ncbi:MAG TPA: alcohol dehydrogenase catalytic domain-containing protein, partial [Acidimicrobiales bacterium]|nr:alcohol dehydrogenase catalytic domain-containing protein [Acidimicrobiales bacterium]
MDVDDTRPLRPDWVVTRPLLAGICGSDSKMALLDFGEEDTDNAMAGLCSFPQVMGHEVVAEVVSAGPDADGVEVGQRVVLNPWLSCVPRGVKPLCPSCEVGDYSLCHNFTAGEIAVGIHTGLSSDATGGYAELMPAHPTMLFPVPDSVSDEQAVLADPFSVSLHAVTRHAPPAGGRALVYGAGALGTTAIAILRALYPDVEVAVIARFDAQADLARKLGASVVLAPDDRMQIIEELAAWSGGRLVLGTTGLPMCHPGGIDVVYDTIGKPETLEVGVRLLRARGTLVKAGFHAPGRWEWSPLYFKELNWVGSNAFGIEEVEGVRRHAIEHYLALVSAGRVDITPMLTHTFRLEQWREAFAALADQASSGAIKVAFDHREGESGVGEAGARRRHAGTSRPTRSAR